jgi:lactoylglutathione lyase
MQFVLTQVEQELSMIAAERTGCILHVERYEACVRFYSECIGLRVEFEKNEPGQLLTILDFGGAYLMIERGGNALDGGKSAAENPVTVRFNVADLDAAAAQLRAKGVKVQVTRFDWGVIGDFWDPDGNLCQLREAASFGG